MIGMYLFLVDSSAELPNTIRLLLFLHIAQFITK